MTTGRKPSPGQTAAQRAHAEREAARYQALPKERKEQIVKTRDRAAQQAADNRRHQKDKDLRNALHSKIQRDARESGRSTAQTKARATAKLAKATGKIKTPATCESPGCKNPPSHMHHKDYNKPMEVSHLCTTCHGAADRASGASARGKYA